MQMQFGRGTFEIDPNFSTPSFDELHLQIEKGTPKVINKWNCDPPGFSDPDPAITKIDAHARLLFHAADYKLPYSFSGHPNTPAELKKRKSDVNTNSRALVAWLMKEGGFKSTKELGAALQKDFGQKKDLKIPFDAMVDPYRLDYSVQITTTVLYETFDVTHPNMPLHNEVAVLLMIPISLEHTIQLTAQCGSEGQTEIWGWEDGPEEAVRVDVQPSRTDKETKLRREAKQHEVDAQKKVIEELEWERKRIEERLKRERETLEKLERERG